MDTDEPPQPQPGAQANFPAPASERASWLLAAGLAALGVAVLALALTLGGGTTGARRAALPPVVAAPAATPVASPAEAASVLSAQARSAGRHRARSTRRAIVARPSPAQQRGDATRFVDQTQTHIATRWMEGFYPIYGEAQRTFGVNWLLIASIHRQESAFSTAPDTYSGLNFAGCCGGPMQFNVTNGPVTTWQLVERLIPLRHAPASLRPRDRDAPVDLRRLRLDHGGRAPALGRRRGLRARRPAPGTPRTTTTATTRPASPTQTRCWRARSAGHSTASASTAASITGSSKPCTRRMEHRCWRHS